MQLYDHMYCKFYQHTQFCKHICHHRALYLSHLSHNLCP
eukprot:13661.XXX_524797_524913_1 [CDS] Oithona nana genome sequencing.